MADKTYLVVGGSHGIGLGIVGRLLHAGSEVTTISRTWEADQVGEQVFNHPKLTHVQRDVTSEEIEPAELPASIHGLVYCPGSITLGPVRQLKSQVMIDDFQLNVVGAVKSLQAALPALKASGSASMVMFSTVAVSQGMTMHASVASSKGAVEGLTRSLAAELAPVVRVNCIAPALTDTPLSARFLSSDQKRQAMSEKYPLKRVGEVDDIASMAEYLLSDSSAWITGQIFGVDGGMSTVRC